MSDETPGAGQNAQPPREGSAPRPSIRFPQVTGAQYYITTTQSPRAIPALSQIPVVSNSGSTSNATSHASGGGTLVAVPRIITISPSSSRTLQTHQISSPVNRPSLVNRSIVSALTGRPHPAVRTQLFPGNATVVPTSGQQQQMSVTGVVNTGNTAIISSSPSTASSISYHLQPHFLHHQTATIQTSPTSTPRSSPLKRTLPPTVQTNSTAILDRKYTIPDQSTSIASTAASLVGPTAAKRQRVMNHRIVKSKLLREKYNEHILEQYYAAAGGQILDLHQFAKRPRTQQYLAYMREHAIDPKEYDSVTQTTMPPHQSVISSTISSQMSPSTLTLLTPSTSTPLITLTPAPQTQGTTAKATIASSIPALTTSSLSTTSLNAPPAATQTSSLPGNMLNNNQSLNNTIGTMPLLKVGVSALDSTVEGVCVNKGSLATAGGSSNKMTTPQQSYPSQQTSTSGGNQQEQIVEKAKQEAYVVQRISELQKEGLWPEKRLPKIQEMPRAKAHWDYLLEEMVWLAADFAQERKWKKAAAKKCARMVQKYFQDKAVAAQKAEKAQEQHLRRVAAFCAKEVRNFWSNVEKLVEYKQNTRLEEKRKKALDQHLSFIVDQTEKYSQLLAEGMNKSTIVESTIPPSTTSSNPVSRIHSDEEFQPSDENSTDDEETIAQEEAAADETDDKKDEVEALQRESEMDFEAFLSELPKDYLQNRDKIRLSDEEEEQEAEEAEEAEEDSESEEEFTKKQMQEPETGSSSSLSNQANERRTPKKDVDFTADSDSADDEDTIREQEANENPDEHKEELYDLNVESQLTIEELRARYSNLPDVPPSGSEEDYSDNNDTDSNDDYSDDNSERVEQYDMMDSDSDVDVTSDSHSGNIDSDDTRRMEEVGLKSLLEDDNDRDEDDLLNDAAAIAESIQPKGNTLSSTSVVTKIPFLLKFCLREYQHIGLDWLVTMFERKLNGILADEMGLGKTIQTIALLAHLACEKENWGPHLIVVPTSVMLNWEMECKKWCPGFKILTYYGSQKERKQKRTGWTKANAFHICITSYKLVIQDHQSFRRKKWKYLILDEAQNIKNFKSQRWQLLLNFQTQQRLLLTGTPLQNNLMELWSLMHFLMPNVFQSHREFKEWFSNPVTGMIEGNNEYNENIIKRLHKVLRPFLLRRLKCEVEKQMPKKYEHVVMCRLSKRQRFLYDDYMSRAKTRETLATGNLLSVINVLMQLRKVCNHPNLFEVRPTISPFHCEGIIQHFPSLIYAMLEPNYKYAINISESNYNMARLEHTYSAYQCYRLQQYQTPRKLIEEVCRANDSSSGESSRRASRSSVLLDVEPYLPPCRLALQVHQQLHKIKTEPVDSSGERTVVETNKMEPIKVQSVKLNAPTTGTLNSKALKPDPLAAHGYAQVVETSSGKHILLQNTTTMTTANINETTTVFTPSGQKVTTLPIAPATGYHSTKATLKVEMSTLPTPLLTDSDDNSRLNIDQIEIDTRMSVGTRFIEKLFSNQPQPPSSSNAIMAPRGSGRDSLDVRWRQGQSSSSPVVSGAIDVLRDRRSSSGSGVADKGTRSTRSVSFRSSSDKKDGDHHHHHHHHHHRDHKDQVSRHHSSSNRHHYSTSSNQQTDVRIKIDMIHRVNTNRCRATPIYGTDLLEATRIFDLPEPSSSDNINGSSKSTYSEMLGYSGLGENIECYRWFAGLDACVSAQTGSRGMNCTNGLKEMVCDGYVGRIDKMTDIFNRFIVYVPAAHAPEPELQVWHPPVSKYWGEKRDKRIMIRELFEPTTPLHSIASAMVTQFPHPRLIQYDCGKLQTLDRLLRKLKVGGHRVLIFTQMTKMLDVLEAFLNFHGHIYLRLDGTTRVDQRQMLMERFNGDKRIFVFILSTRSGGVGVNLTGADTVIFYDSDWNPTMDAQAQDRCHRIGQTRDVHIYRLVSERTIEENILKKANQKRLLGDLAIEGGNFTTAYFKSSTIQDLFTVDQSATSTASSRMSDLLQRQQQDQEIIDPITTTIIEDIPDSSIDTPATAGEKTAIGALETALAAAEDDQDVIAARTAKAEAVADLAEFDENIPLEDVLKEKEGLGGRDQAIEISKAEMEVENIVKQLTPIERYAMKFIEETEAAWSQAQLEAAEREIEAQKREWEENRLAAMREEAERRAKELEEEQRDQLTFPREDAINQVWVSDNSTEQMPMWCPPTPPEQDGDVVHIDAAVALLYDTTTVISEARLPPVYVKREGQKRSRVEAGLGGNGSRRSSKLHRSSGNVNREGVVGNDGTVAGTAGLHTVSTTTYAPRSLFDRPNTTPVKIRRDLKLAKYRELVRSGQAAAIHSSTAGAVVPGAIVPGIPTGPAVVAAAQVAGTSKYTQQGTATVVGISKMLDPPVLHGWTIHEDMALLKSVRTLQRLPLKLRTNKAAHTPNWDFVSDYVNTVSICYRSAKQCKIRYETVIVSREEGKQVFDTSPKKKKKQPNLYTKFPVSKSNKSLCTFQMYSQDNNISFTQNMTQRYDAIKCIPARKPPPPIKITPCTSTPTHHPVLKIPPKHVAVFTEAGIDLEHPVLPVEIAQRRAERVAREKKAALYTKGSIVAVAAAAAAAQAQAVAVQQAQVQAVAQQQQQQHMLLAAQQQQVQQIHVQASLPITPSVVTATTGQIVQQQPQQHVLVPQQVVQVQQQQLQQLQQQQQVQQQVQQQQIVQVSATPPPNSVVVSSIVTTMVSTPTTPPSTALRTQRLVASPLATTSVVSVSGLSPAQLQAATQRLIVSGTATVAGQSKPGTATVIPTAGGTKTITSAQLQMIRQAATLKQQLRLQQQALQQQQQQGVDANSTGTVQVQQAVKSATVTIAGQQAVQVQFSQAQPRTQYVKSGTVAVTNKQGITRTVTESEIAQLIKRQQHALQHAAQQQQQQQQKALAAAVAASGSGALVQQGGQGTTTTTLQGLSPQQLAHAIQQGAGGTSGTLGSTTNMVGVAVKTVAGSTVTGVTLGTNPTGAKTTTLVSNLKPATAQNLRQVQQQLLAQKKLTLQSSPNAATQKLTSLAQVNATTGKVVQGGMQTAQLIVGPKPLGTSTITMQQFQQVMQQRNPLQVTQGGSSAVGTQQAAVVLSKGPRVIPLNAVTNAGVGVVGAGAGQAGNKPTIQVVTATSQALNSSIRGQTQGNVGANPLSGIKVHTPGSHPHAALINQMSVALAQQQSGQSLVRQQQQSQGATGSPVRIQTSQGQPLVAVTVHQAAVAHAQAAANLQQQQRGDGGGNSGGDKSAAEQA